MRNEDTRILTKIPSVTSFKYRELFLNLFFNNLKQKMEQNKLLFSEGTGKSKKYFIKFRNLRIQKLAFFRCAIFFSILLVSFLIFGVENARADCSPSDISGLTLWFDASQGVTSDGTTPATDGDTVQQWNDQSATGANATQATEGSRPTYKTGILNGKPEIWFAGSHTLVTSSFLSAV